MSPLCLLVLFRHAEVEKAEMVEMEVELRAEPEEPEEPEADLLILWREP